MYELVYDVQIEAWVSINLATQRIERKISEYALKRRGFFPYAYNFVRGFRGEEAQCYLCGKFILMRDATRDHTWPKSLGGEFTSVACERCNTTKRNMRPIEWAIKSLEYDFVYGVPNPQTGE